MFRRPLAEVRASCARTTFVSCRGTTARTSEAIVVRSADGVAVPWREPMMLRIAFMAYVWIGVSVTPAFAADAEPTAAYPISSSLPGLAGDVDWARTPIRL